jgi:hypothetical protein
MVATAAGKAVRGFGPSATPSASHRQLNASEAKAGFEIVDSAGLDKIARPIDRAVALAGAKQRETGNEMALKKKLKAQLWNQNF